ncbi:MAG: AI-2E family transporter [Planctomycetota bacterium]
MVTWGVFLGLVYTLRNLFAVFFITFVISYICRNFVKFVYSPFGQHLALRRIIVIFTFALLLFGFYIGGRFLVPNAVEQGQQIVKIVRDLRIHEDVDNAVPNLYASLRFWFYKDSDEYRNELKTYRESVDPIEVDYDIFKRESERIKNAFKVHVIQDFGQRIYEEKKSSAEFQEEYDDYIDARIEKDYERNKTALESEEEQELRENTPSTYERFKNKHGSTPETWSDYLKDRIIFKLYKRFDLDLQKRREVEDAFKEMYIQREGEKVVQQFEGKPEWIQRFETDYEMISGKDRLYNFEEYFRLEGASNQKEYRELMGDEVGIETRLDSDFDEKKEMEFAEAFKEYGFVEELNQKIKRDFLPGVATWVASTIEYTVTLVFHLILSIFLSFFLVWDIPRLKELISRLETSRMSEFYKEVCPGLVSFGSLMGRAFQAQALIAIVNTMLTLSALYILDMPHKTFLSAIVFICSFIPVVGVIISSIPMVVVGLQEPNGLIVALELVGCVLIVHFIETTLLNPKIMGDMLKLHPLLVLIILLVGEHFFGVWGLLLGVPITVYIFRFVILKDRSVGPERT